MISDKQMEEMNWAMMTPDERIATLERECERLRGEIERLTENNAYLHVRRAEAEQAFTEAHNRWQELVELTGAGKHLSTITGTHKAVCQWIQKQEAEVNRLKRGDFTPEEFQNLCHHRDEQPGCTQADFQEGCHLYQKRLFGSSEREHFLARLDGPGPQISMGKVAGIVMREQAYRNELLVKVADAVKAACMTLSANREAKWHSAWQKRSTVESEIRMTEASTITREISESVDVQAIIRTVTAPCAGADAVREVDSK